MSRNRRWTGVLVGGFIAGVLDIIYAFIILGQRGTTPLQVLQSIASGLMGRSAFEAGVPAGVLGLFCHFVIAFGAATVYFLAARRLPILTEQAVLCGLLFGVGVYLFMNFVVLPLSAFPLKMSYPPRVLLRGCLSIAILVGLPIALAVRHFSTAPKPA